MKVVTIHNQKGGEGKTTATGIVADIIAKRKAGDVLVIDAAPQSTLTKWLHTEKINGTIADVLQRKIAVSAAINKVADNLWILGNTELSGLWEYSESVLPQEPTRFLSLMNDLACIGFSYCLIDMDPGSGTLHRTVMYGVDDYYIIMRPETFSTGGYLFSNKLVGSINEFRRHISKPPLRIKKKLVNCYNEGFAGNRAIVGAMKTLNHDYIIIPQSREIPNAQTLDQIAQKGRAVEAFAKVADDIMGVGYGG